MKLVVNLVGKFVGGGGTALFHIVNSTFQALFSEKSAEITSAFSIMVLSPSLQASSSDFELDPSLYRGRPSLQ